jgi:hypothetical protein
MKLSTTINLPTYSCKIIIRIVDSVATEAEKIYKKCKIKDDFGDEAEGALIMHDIDVYYLLLGVKYLTHNTIAHEMFHAVVRVTEDRGISDEEAQAWLAGHLTAVLYKFLEKKKLEIKHG